MSKRLEDFIKMNRDEFDDLEPSGDLWARIEKNLPPEGTAIQPREAKTFSLSFVLKVAASVIIVMGIGFGLVSAIWAATTLRVAPQGTVTILGRRCAVVSV